MSVNRKTTLFLVIALGLVGLMTYSRIGAGGETDYHNTVRKNTILFGELYKQIAHKYVEKIDPEKLMRVGINAMLEAIDPYTVLIEDEENVQLQIITQGKYGGLGMLVGSQNEWPTVVEPPYEGTPAMKAGIREGDRIIEIDGESTRGKPISEVASKLRGEKGTAVTIKIQREGESNPIEFRLIRAEIVIKDVEYAGVIHGDIGYIKLTRFSKNAEREVKSAVLSLREQGAKSLILDLRNNPGGLLEAAVGVADAFLERGKPIVSTRGRLEETFQEYISQNIPVAGDLPLVVLINELSASASEIVAGTIQDWDRGVIIGRPSFGKGLVQSVVPLTREARLKLTTAKYYLPSGRLIQRQSFARELLLDEPDSTRGGDSAADKSRMFKTAAGREVHGGGGIEPDVVVAADSLNEFERALLRQSMMFNYAVSYASRHPDLQKGFEVDHEMLENFQRFLEEKNFSFKTDAERELAELRQAMAREGTAAQAVPAFQALEASIAEYKRHLFVQSLDFVKRQLAMEISAKLWDTATKIEAGLGDDRDLEKAFQILKTENAYQAILRPNAK